MSYLITCYTLFDITHAEIVNRHKPINGEDSLSWRYKRNTQSNLDTILQVVSLRSQPENITTPIRKDIRFDKFDKFGFLFEQQEDELYPCWSFMFEISHPSVFDDGISELGALYNDCDGVPMILCGTEWNKLVGFLDVTPELKNIYFVTDHDKK